MRFLLDFNNKLTIIIIRISTIYSIVIPMKTLVNPIRTLGWCIRLYLLYVFFTLPKWRNLLSNGVNTVRPLTSYMAKVVLIMVLVVSFTLPVYAQEILWKELKAKTDILYQQEQYSEAISVGKESLKIAEETFGSAHPNVASTLNNLAGLFQAQGKYAEAEPLYKRALKIYEKALGTEHPKMASTLNNLAGLCQDQGKNTESSKSHWLA